MADVPALADDYLSIASNLVGDQNTKSEIHGVFQNKHPGLTDHQFRQVLGYVKNSGWADPTIQHNLLMPPASILPPGYKRLAELSGETPPPSTGPKIHIETMANYGLVAIGNHNTQVQNLEVTAGDLAEILSVIREHRPADQDDSEEWDDLEATIVEEASPAAIRTALRWFAGKLDDVSTRTAGAVLGGALSGPALELIKPIFGG